MVLNVKEHDDPNIVSLRFLSTNSIKRDYYLAISEQIRSVKQDWEENGGTDCVVRNLVLKSIRPQLSVTKHHAKENFPMNKSPIRSKGLTLLPKKGTPTQNQLQNTSRILFKLNFDVGSGKIAKLPVRQGENFSKYIKVIDFILILKDCSTICGSS